MNKIETKITCPDCKTVIDIGNIKYAIRDRIIMIIDKGIDKV